VERTVNRALPLILAREFAANVATPFVVLDSEGTLVYFNERAEKIIGQSYAELGELPEEEWRARFSVERPDGTAVASEDTPTAIARRERKPARDELVYTFLEGKRRTLSVTATPILGRGDELVGVIALFWEVEEGKE
jgi:PAS domain S-box-containing protein